MTKKKTLTKKTSETLRPKKFHSSGAGSYSSEPMWPAAKSSDQLKKQIEYEKAIVSGLGIFYTTYQAPTY